MKQFHCLLSHPGQFLREAERFYNSDQHHEGLQLQSPDQFAYEQGLPTAPYLPLS